VTLAVIFLTKNYFMPQYLSVFANQKIALDITFECANENMVILRDHASGAELFNGNSHMNHNRHWESPVHSGGGPKIYELRSFHKNTPPNGGEPWFESPERVIFANEVAKVVGYEDKNDGDYNDAVATVTWKRGIPV